ncbi:MAG: nucleoside kinase [Clostridia bacterium]|nr:nucleoside kinase [Clostridia bacterium]
MININYKGNEYTTEKGKQVIDFIKENLDVELLTILACKINYEVKSLNFAMQEDCNLDLIDYTTSDGNRIYVRGLTFIMTQAFEELYPEKKVIVNYSLGHSIYCEDLSGTSITDEELENVRTRMNEIIEKDLPFVKSELSIEDARKMYERSGRTDKLELLETRKKDYVSLYSCGKTINYFYGVMPISTGYMKYYDLVKYENGFLLVYPRRFNPTKVEKIKETKKLYATFNEYDKIHKELGVQNIAELNTWIKEGKVGELIRICEALHEKKIAQIADMIAADKNKKLVLIAGPSSSGKTTFAQRLGIQLRVNGITSVALSMDNYFVNREDTPLDENGNYDFECLEAVDLKLFNEQLSAILNGEEVELPTFDFHDGKRQYLGNKVKLEENQVLIVEGIHGLNEKLTASIPRENKFKIYISALTALNIDNYNRISTADSRMLRRTLRDLQFRNHPPKATIKMWPSVRAGEEKYIFPFQEDADAMFNSSLVYEAAVIKNFLEPALLEVEKDCPEYSEAKRLYEFLSYFLPIDPKDVPITSIVREFVGDGCFYR